MMKNQELYIVQTGTANIGSVIAAFKRLGTEPKLVTDPDQILSASFVVVPGVGTLGSAMEKLIESKSDEMIKKRVEKNLPTLFVCVGLQIMGEESEESPGIKGLGIIHEKVSKFPKDVKVPQHGWNYIHPPANSQFITPGFAYFSNSYKFSKVPKEWNPSQANYGGIFVAAVEKGSVLALQFHPELSGPWGISIFKKWLGLETEIPDSKKKKTESEIPHVKTHRIIPCLDVRNGKVVKGIQFQNIKEAGDPAERAQIYEKQGADELVVLDISATIEERKTTLETIQQVRNVLSIPLCVGGGVKSIEDAQKILEAGADKVAVNTAAVKNPSILNEMAKKFGSQCTVLSLDASRSSPEKWEVVINAGKTKTGIDAIEWAKEGESRGAGEILLTSFDKDGTKSGYDNELIKAVSEAVHIPIIASGGAASSDHLAEGLSHGADAVLAASIFHYEEMTVQQVKEDLRKKGISIRLE